MRIRRIGAIILRFSAIAAAIQLCQCRDLQSVGNSAQPLVFLVSPSYGGDPAALEGLRREIQKHSGLALEIRVAPSEQAAVVRGGTPNVDIGLLPIFGYLLCRQEFGVQASLRVVRRGGAQRYRGEILVLRKSPITSLRGLAGKRVAFVTPHSTTGFLLPAKRLRAAGIRFIPVFAGSHDAALTLLRTGKVDAAAAYEGASRSDPRVRVVGRTDTIPNEPIFFRSGLAAAKRARLTQALRKVASDANGQRTLRRIAGITGFVPTTDERYTKARAAIEAAGKKVEDLVPQGWWIRNQARLTPSDYAP